MDQDVLEPRPVPSAPFLAFALQSIKVLFDGVLKILFAAA